MTEREQIEQQIRNLITADMDSTTFSNLLYQQGTGLFSRLGPTVEDRQAIIQTDLWKLAQQRLRELEARDVVRFREVVKKVEEYREPGSFVLKLEPAPTE